MKYKHLSIVSILFITMTQGIFAQNSAIVNAIFYKRDSNFVKAKEEIDNACVHEKTLNSPKGWYIKGEIYENIALSTKPEITALDTNAIVTAYEAYNKSITFDKPNGGYAKQAKDRLANVWVVFINKGIGSYKNKKYDDAIKYYSLAVNIKPEDTTAYIYGSYATEAKQDITACNTIYEQLLKLNYKSVLLYFGLIRYAKEVEKDYDKALILTSKAKAIYPHEITFITEEFNIYLAQGKKDLAKQKLEEAIQKDPDNSLLYFNLGVITEQLGPKEKAPEYYQKAIDLNPKNTDALFNLGAYFYHQAAEIYIQTNKMSFKEYTANGKALEQKANDLFKIALPNFEKVYAINADAQTKKILFDIYNRLQMKEKLNELLK